MKTALLVIDIQNDYFPGGNMELEGSIEASEKAKKILSAFRERSLPVIHIQHISSRPGATFFIPGTEGVEVCSSVKPLPTEMLIQKHFPNSFRETSLLEHLRGSGIEHVVITGMMTHMCVDATTRAAFDHGFQCTVLHDACATRPLSFKNDVVPAKQVHASFLAALGAVYANIISTDEFIMGMG